MRFALGRACVMTFCVFAELLLLGCAAEKKTDYGPYLSHMPKSVLVLPPLNESTHVTAPDAFLSTITAPLAEISKRLWCKGLADVLRRRRNEARARISGSPPDCRRHSATRGRAASVSSGLSVYSRRMTAASRSPTVALRVFPRMVG